MSNIYNYCTKLIFKFIPFFKKSKFTTKSLTSNDGNVRTENEFAVTNIPSTSETPIFDDLGLNFPVDIYY